MNKILTLLFILALATSLTAQPTPWLEGTVTTPDGETLPGMLRLSGGPEKPWLNFEKVYFVPADDWEGDGRRLKKKTIVTYEPEDLQAYNTYQLDEIGERSEVSFESHEIEVRGLLKKKQEQRFLQRVDSGRVEVFLFIPAPEKKLVTDATQREADYNNAQLQSTTYLRKAGLPLVPTVEAELTELLKECPEVIAKIEAEEYGFKPLDRREKKKGFGKLIAMSFGDNGLEGQLLQAVQEYNACAR